MSKRTREKEYYLLEKVRRMEKEILDSLSNHEEKNESETETNECPTDNEDSESINESKEEEEKFEVFIDEEEEPTLYVSQEVLNILGAAPASTPKKTTLHKDIAERWTAVLETGLKKEEKETISEENPCFENIIRMSAPKLNKEVAAALNENAKKRDAILESRQKQTSTALACLGQALELLLGNIEEEKLTIIKKINEAARLLCDNLYLDNKGRRKLILTIINKDLRNSLLETEPGHLLFGEDLSDKIKTAKVVQKTGKDLKTQPMVDRNKRNFKSTEVTARTNRSLNWRGPPRGAAQDRYQRPAFNRFSHQQPRKKNEERTPSRRGKK